MLVSYLLTKPTLKVTIQSTQSTINTSKTVLSLMLGTALFMSISGCDIKQRPVNKDTQQKVDSTTNNVLIQENIADETTDISLPETSENVVEVMEITLKDIPQTKEFPAIATSSETYEVHPKVSGTVTDIDFKQGHWVKVGEPLYRVNPQKVKASVETKKASIKKAEASLTSAVSAYKKALAMLKKNKMELTQAKNDLNRYKRLIKDKAVSQQKYQQAVSEVNKAQASINSTKALVNKADADIKIAEADIDLAKNQLNDDKQSFGLSVLKAPITGMVLDASIRKGQKVVAESTDSFVTIAKVNPIFVDIYPTAEELVQIKEMLVLPNKSDKQVTKKTTKETTKETTKKDSNTEHEVTTPNITDDMVKKHEVSLVLEKGQPFAHLGTFKFNETKIDDNNKITMRVRFPNNKGLLLPNMKVTAKVTMPTLTDVILVPMTSVMHMPTKTADKMAEQPNEVVKGTANETTAKPKEIKANDSNDKAIPEATVENRKQSSEIKKTTPQPTNDFAHFVYVVNANNQAQLRSIQVGGTYKDQMIVSGGLFEGDKVIIDSSEKIEPKQSVVIKNKKLTKEAEKTSTKGESNAQSTQKTE